MFKQFTASAPGKIILTGEHAVVHGTRAIATVVDKRTFVTFNPGNDGQLSFLIRYADYTLHYIWTTSQLDEIISIIIEHLNKKVNITTKDELFAFCTGNDNSLDHIVDTLDTYFPRFPDPIVQRVDKDGVPKVIPMQDLTSALELCPPRLFLTYFILYFQCRLTSLSLETRSDLPMGAGLGSSASLCAAMSAGFCHLAYILSHSSPSTCVDTPQFTDDELHTINRWAYQGERIIHGNASGVDNTCCVYGGVIIYRREPGASQPDLSFLPSGSIPSSMSLIITNTNVPKDTKALVAKVGKLKQDRPAVMTPLLQSFDTIASQFLDAIESYLKEAKEIPLPPVTLESNVSLVSPTPSPTVLPQPVSSPLTSLSSSSSPSTSVTIVQNTNDDSNTTTATIVETKEKVDPISNTTTYETTETTITYDVDDTFPHHLPTNIDPAALRLYESFAQLIPINQHLLEAIGVGHPKITEVCGVSGKFNLVTKLTGAGGGGCVITLGSPEITQIMEARKAAAASKSAMATPSPSPSSSPSQSSSKDIASAATPSLTPKQSVSQTSVDAETAASVNQLLNLSLETSNLDDVPPESVKSPIDLFEEEMKNIGCECYRTVMGQRGVVIEY